MAHITIHDLDDALESRLTDRAACHGQSIEEEARDILRAALAINKAPDGDLAAAIRARFACLGGVELQLGARDAMRTPPSISE